MRKPANPIELTPEGALPKSSGFSLAASCGYGKTAYAVLKFTRKTHQNPTIIRLRFPMKPCSMSMTVNGQRGQMKRADQVLVTPRRLSPQPPFEKERASHGYI